MYFFRFTDIFYLPAYLPHLFVTMMLLFVPGYLLAGIKFLKLSGYEKLACAPAFGTALISILTLVINSFAPYPSGSYTWAGLAVLVVSLVMLLMTRRSRATSKESLFVVGIYVGLVIITSLFLSLSVKMPYDWGLVTYSKAQVMAGGLATDNSIPYRVIQFLLNRMDFKTDNFFGIWGIADRTPLMGLVGTFVVAFFQADVPTKLLPGTAGLYSYNIFEIVAILLNSSFVFSAYLLFKEVFDKRAARLTLLLFLVNSYVFVNTFYAWPKFMATYFVFLFYFYIKKNRLLLAATFGALAYLCHNLALFYLLGGVVYLILNTENRKNIVGRVVLVVGSLAVLLWPWFYWTSKVLGEASQFFLYPLAIRGLIDGEKLTIVKILADLKGVPLENLIVVRANSILFSILPVELVNSIINFAPMGESYLRKLPFRIYHANIYSLFTTVGLIGAPLFWLSLFKYYEKYKKELLGLILIPFVGLVLISGWRDVMSAMVSMEPLVPVLIAFLAVSITQKFIKHKIMSFFPYLLIIEFLAVIWGYLYFVRGTPMTVIMEWPNLLILSLLLLSQLYVVGKFLREWENYYPDFGMSKLLTALSLFLIIGAGVFLRSEDIGAHYNMIGEGGWHDIVARNHVEYGLNQTKFLSVLAVRNGQNRYYLGHPPLFELMLAGVFSMLGTSEMSARILVISMSGLSILLIFIIVRLLANDLTAILAAFIFSFMPVLAYEGKIVNYAPASLFFALWVVATFLMFLVKGKKTYFFLAILGTVLGALTDWTFYPISIILLVYAAMVHKGVLQAAILSVVEFVSAVLYFGYSVYVAGNAGWMLEHASQRSGTFEYLNNNRIFPILLERTFLNLTPLIFGLSVLGLVIALWRVSRKGVVEATRLEIMAILMFVFVLVFKVIFAKNFYDHIAYPSLTWAFYEFGPAVAVLVGIAISWLFGFLKNFGVLRIWFLIVILSYILVSSVLVVKNQYGQRGETGYVVGREINRLFGTDRKEFALLREQPFEYYSDVPWVWGNGYDMLDFIEKERPKVVQLNIDEGSVLKDKRLLAWGYKLVSSIGNYAIWVRK